MVFGFFGVEDDGDDVTVTAGAGVVHVQSSSESSSLSVKAPHVFFTAVGAHFFFWLQSNLASALAAWAFFTAVGVGVGAGFGVGAVCAVKSAQKPPPHCPHMSSCHWTWPVGGPHDIASKGPALE